MSINRRDFIRSSASSGAAMLLSPAWMNQASQVIPVPASLSIYVMATNWGYPGSIEDFCAKAREAGYDGIEVGWPTDAAEQKRLLAATTANKLRHAFLIGVWENLDATAHLKSFEKKLMDAAATSPMYINCHAGKDFFTYEQNVPFINLTAKVSAEKKIPIYHETHRGRILYSAPIAKSYMEKLPNLRLTLDISHWCAVHESLLGDQPQTVDMALSRTDHIHARIGHAEGPQVNDPRAPEWRSAVDAHWGWWDSVVKKKSEAGASTLTFLTEFGPPDYLPALPYTRQPVADQWDINMYMMQMIRKRYPAS